MKKRLHNYRCNRLMAGAVIAMMLLGGSGAVAQVNVGGSVYGGGALANVNGAAQVDVLSGTIEGSVYGGGLGQKNGVNGATSDIAAIVSGDATVNIGSVNETNPIYENGSLVYYNNVVINGYVFGANNLNGTPQGDVVVNIYHTKHTAANKVPTGITTAAGVMALRPTSGWDATGTADDSQFALKGVYGGGNLAHYEPTNSTKMAKVNIYGCENTIDFVYGGGKAANGVNTDVTINGGFIDTVFAGGDGSAAGTRADLSGDVKVTINGGLFSAAFGGSNTRGDIGGTMTVDVNNDGDCGELIIGNLFGGGNLAATNAANLAIACPTSGSVTAPKIGDIYGGGNQADVTNNVTLTIAGGTYNNVFGGNNQTGTIGGNVTLLLTGGTMTNAFGGNNAGGKINGNILVSVVDAESERCPLRITNVYGGGKDAAYSPTNSAALSPKVNIRHLRDHGGSANSIAGDVFGGGLGSTATVTANPVVTIGAVSGDSVATVDGTVYGGGSQASVDGNTTVIIQKDNTVIGGSVYGAGKGAASDPELANVSGNATVTMNAGHVKHNIYGGGELSSVGVYTYSGTGATKTITGYTSGGYTYVDVNGGLVGIRPTNSTVVLKLNDATSEDETHRRVGRAINRAGHVFGGGLGAAGTAYANFAFVAYPQVTIDGGDAMASVFGGGENGHVFKDSKVYIKSGTVGFDMNFSSDKDLNEYAEYNGQGIEIFYGNVYGGGRGIDYDGDNNLSLTAGRVRGNSYVYMTGGRVVHNVYGGGSMAIVGMPDDDNTGLATVSITGGIVGYDDGHTTFDAAGNYTYDGTDYASLSDANKAKVQDFYMRAGNNEGRVYGSGRGEVTTSAENAALLTQLAFVKNTSVTIGGTGATAAQVRGSVFGGGANGHVRKNTNVYIQGDSKIGVPLQNAPYWYDNIEWKLSNDGYLSYDTMVVDGSTEKLSYTYYQAEPYNAMGIHMHERCKRDDGVGPTVYRGNVYAGGRGVTPVSTTGGDVAHYTYSATAGRVYGNATLTISGGIVYNDVYGGGSLASVGNIVSEVVDASTVKGLLGNTFTKTNAFTMMVADAGGETVALSPSTARDYRVDDPIANTGLATVTITNGQIGTDGINNGSVFGSGRGVAGNATATVTHLANATNTNVSISGGHVHGAVFGGGANGHVLQNTNVAVSGTAVIGDPMPLAERKIDEETGHGHRIYRANVYGGGRGVDPVDNETHLSTTAGRVYGNTNVVISGGQVFHSVYGGGSLASVGSYSLRQIDGEKKHLYIQGTGQAAVTIKGNAWIGHKGSDVETVDASDPATIKAARKLLGETDSYTVTAQDIIELNYHYLGANIGMVFGSGRGVAALREGNLDVDYSDAAFTRNTIVNVTNDGGIPVVVGSVFGGGENGHVKHNTYVHISGGIIGGIPLHNEGFHPGVASENGIDLGGNYASFKFSPNASTHLELEHEDSENEFGHGAAVYRGNVYGGGRGVDHEDSENPEESYSATAGRVYGSVKVVVDGGAIYHHVFGGGSLASVGTYTTDANGYPTEEQDIYEYKLVYGDTEGHSYSDTRAEGSYATRGGGAAADDPDSLYVKIATPGNVTVNVSGGQIGTHGINEGSVFGGGRGIAGDVNKAVTHLAYCDNTYVTISGSADIRGNVFGGGANGHVLDDSHVTMTGGTVGATLTPADTAMDAGGKSPVVFHGNVYGGGRGVDPIHGTGVNFSYTAGRVYGDSYVTISGGLVRRNVYGGGSLATVGTVLYKKTESESTPSSLAPVYKNANDHTQGFIDEYGIIKENTGTATVLISGGQIGSGGFNNGRVFGSCRGMAGPGYSNRAYVHNTVVTVNDTADVRGCVFGSGENGHVQDNTSVTIGGTAKVGTKLPSDYADLSDDNKRKYDYIGNVYGGGRGVDTYLDENGDEQFSYSAGYVRGATNVLVTGTPTIYRNVYGGGSMGLVGEYGLLGAEDFWNINDDGTAADWTGSPSDATFWEDNGGIATVTIQGTVGYSDNVDKGYGGNVYGSSRGRANEPDGNPATTVASGDEFNFGDKAYVVRTHVIVNTGANVLANVYGGGENGHVDWGGTLVDILAGTVAGNVFGGGKGSVTSPTAGIVDGPVQVNIGSVAVSEGTRTFSGSATIGGAVFGGNDTYSSPIGQIKVDVYKAGARIPAVYGGGNLASILTGDQTTDHSGEVLDALYITDRIKPTGTKPTDYNPWPGIGTDVRKCVVTIHGCDNVIGDVYGGGNAATTLENEVIVYGGTIDNVFAGGNGYSATNNHTDPSAANYNPGAPVGYVITGNPTDNNSRPLGGSGNATANIHGGAIGAVYAGSNQWGTINGTSAVTVDNTPEAGTSACTESLATVYGGGNEAPGNAGTITVNCGANIVDLYGGANAADVTSDITLNLSGGTINRAFGGNNQSGTISGDITVNVNEGSSCTLDLGYVFGGGNEASYGGTPVVNLINGTVTHNVFGGGNEAGVAGADIRATGANVGDGIYGGCNTSGSVTGDVLVTISAGTIGSHTDGTSGVWGGGLGQETRVNGSVTVAISGASTTIDGDIYGGSAKGKTNCNDAGDAATADKSTTVNITEGTVTGNVYGGGLGDASYAADVWGIVKVNIGDGSTGPAINGMVFGCNNANGSPKDSVFVNIYKTAHTTGDGITSGNGYPTSLKSKAAPTDELNGDDLLALTDSEEQSMSDAARYALSEVYGGGNKADYVPVSSSKATNVKVYGCEENTVQFVYGGGRAADIGNSTIAASTSVYIEGGHIQQVFAGGDGHTLLNPNAAWNATTNPYQAANIWGDASVTIEGGLIDQVFGGSNTTGQIYGTSNVKFEPVNTCDLLLHEAFGGGNHAEGGSTEVTIPCGYKGEAIIYGGANEATITGSVTLNIEGGTMTRVFGGSKKSDITGDVTVNVYGGHIGELFGGNNISGNIGGTIEVNVDWGLNDCNDPLFLGYVYGGGRQAPYEPTATKAKGAGKYSPVVNIIQATVSNAVFGGGYGDDPEHTGNLDAHVGFTTDLGTSSHVPVNPKVVIGAYRTKNRAGTTVDEPNNLVEIGTVKNELKRTLDGDVFGGGNAGPVYGSPYVIIQGSRTKVWNNVYGGGNSAIVTGDPKIEIGSMPRLSKPEFSIDGSGNLVITSHEKGVIYYTVNGSAPVGPADADPDNATPSGETKYTAPINVTAGDVVRAIVVKKGFAEIATEHSYSTTSAVGEYTVE